MLPWTRLYAFGEVMREWREKSNMVRELKWTKVSRGKINEYKSLVDLFFMLCKSRRISFRSMVVDTSEIDYNRHHGGDKELGFYKFYYMFLLHKFGKFAVDTGRPLVIFLDRRTSSYSLTKFRTILNNGINKKFGGHGQLIRDVQAIDSKQADALQIADVLMGAIGYHYNDLHIAPGASEAKIELAGYIARKAGFTSLKIETSYSMKHFQIWKCKLGYKNRK